MAQIKLLPSAAYLQACFIYRPETGELIWRERPREHFANLRAWSRCRTQFAGKPAGGIEVNGRRVIRLGNVPYQAHRIVWKLMTGEEPPATIDHINGDPLDNRWANLRAATMLQQSGNQPLQSNNTSGYRGVSRHLGGKWLVQLGKRYLGLFDTPEAASAAYEAAAREYFGEFYKKRPL